MWSAPLNPISLSACAPRHSGEIEAERCVSNNTRRLQRFRKKPSVPTRPATVAQCALTASARMLTRLFARFRFSGVCVASGLIRQCLRCRSECVARRHLPDRVGQLDGLFNLLGCQASALGDRYMMGNTGSAVAAHRSAKRNQLSFEEGQVIHFSLRFRSTLITSEGLGRPLIDLDGDSH
jgi:hypothetical protein